MSFSVISKGVFFNIICDFILVWFLMIYNFDISVTTFTVWLGVLLFLNAMFAGRAAKKFPELQGLFIGLISALIMFLLLSMSVELDRELNFHVAVIWSFAGFAGGMVGSKVQINRVVKKGRRAK